MKKTAFTFQIDSDAAKVSGEDAFRKIFERGLDDAKHSVRAAASFGFRGSYMAAAVAEAMKLLKEAGRQDSSDAVSLFSEAVECVKSAQVQLQLQHDNDNAVMKDRFEGVAYTGENDPRYKQSVKELNDYCKNFSQKAMTVLSAYDALVSMLGTDKVWMELYSTIISLGDKFIQDVFTGYEINDKLTVTIQQGTEADDLLIKWRSRLEAVQEEVRKEEERRRKEEEERRERERKLEEERLKKEAEERAKREAEEAAERIRKEAEEAAERARKEAAERIAREQKEAEEREAYEQLAQKLNGQIEEAEQKKQSVKAQYDELAASMGSKFADQEAEVNLLNQLIESAHEIETELADMRQERTEKMVKYTKLGVFAGAEKKNLKLELDKLDIEIAGKDSKLSSYKREIESVERRVNSKDNGTRMRLKSFQQEMDKIDAEIVSIRKRLEDEKPAHMQ
jgi:hypothetical protein